MVDAQDFIKYSSYYAAPKAAKQAPNQWDVDHEQTDDSFLRDIAIKTAKTGLSGLGAVGNFLDLPASSIRDIASTLTGKYNNPLDQWLPWNWTSGEHRTSMDDLLVRAGVFNKEKPEGFAKNAGRFGVGVGLEILADPLTYMTFGASALVKGMLNPVKKAGMLDNMGAAVAKSKGLNRYVGPREASMLGTYKDAINYVDDATHMSLAADSIGKMQRKAIKKQNYKSLLDAAPGGTLAARKSWLTKNMNQPIGRGPGSFQVPFEDKAAKLLGVESLTWSPWMAKNAKGNYVPHDWALGYARGLDKTGRAIRYGKYSPIRKLAPSFQKASRGMAEAIAQQFAIKATRHLEDADAFAKTEFAPYLDAIKQSQFIKEDGVLGEGGHVREIVNEHGNLMTEYIEDIGRTREYDGRWTKDGYTVGRRELDPSGMIREVEEIAPEDFWKIPQSFLMDNDTFRKMPKWKPLADAGLLDVVDDIKRQLADTVHRQQTSGSDIRELTDLNASYGPRLFMDSNKNYKMGGASTSFDLSDPFGKARAPHMRDWWGGTTPVQRMSVDSDFAGLYTKAEKAGRTISNDEKSKAFDGWLDRYFDDLAGPNSDRDIGWLPGDDYKGPKGSVEFMSRARALFETIANRDQVSVANKIQMFNINPAEAALTRRLSAEKSIVNMEATKGMLKNVARRGLVSRDGPHRQVAQEAVSKIWGSKVGNEDFMMLDGHATLWGLARGEDPDEFFRHLEFLNPPDATKLKGSFASRNILWQGEPLTDNPGRLVSQAERIIMSDMLPKSMTEKTLIQTLKKNGVKDEEIADLMIPSMFAGARKTATPADVQNWVAEHRVPLGQTILTDHGFRAATESDIAKRGFQITKSKVNGKEVYEVGPGANNRTWQDQQKITKQLETLENGTRYKGAKQAIEEAQAELNSVSKEAALQMERRNATHGSDTGDMLLRTPAEPDVGPMGYPITAQEHAKMFKDNQHPIDIRRASNENVDEFMGDGHAALQRMRELQARIHSAETNPKARIPEDEMGIPNRDGEPVEQSIQRWTNELNDLNETTGQMYSDELGLTANEGLLSGMLQWLDPELLKRRRAAKEIIQQVTTKTTYVEMMARRAELSKRAAALTKQVEDELAANFPGLKHADGYKTESLQELLDRAKPQKAGDALRPRGVHPLSVAPGATDLQEVLIQTKAGERYSKLKIELDDLVAQNNPANDLRVREIQDILSQPRNDLLHQSAEHLGHPDVISSYVRATRIGPKGEKIFEVAKVAAPLHAHGIKKGYVGRDKALIMAEKKAAFQEVDQARQAILGHANVADAALKEAKDKYQLYLTNKLGIDSRGQGRPLINDVQDGVWSEENQQWLASLPIDHQRDVTRYLDDMRLAEARVENLSNAVAHVLSGSPMPEDLTAALSKYDGVAGYNKHAADVADLNQEIKAFEAADMAPDAPFKNTHHQLAMKHAIQSAVDEGYDKIVFASGNRAIEHNLGSGTRLEAAAALGVTELYDSILPNFINDLGTGLGVQAIRVGAAADQELERLRGLTQARNEALAIAGGQATNPVDLVDGLKAADRITAAMEAKSKQIVKLEQELAEIDRLITGVGDVRGMTAMGKQISNRIDKFEAALRNPKATPQNVREVRWMLINAKKEQKALNQMRDFTQAEVLARKEKLKALDQNVMQAEAYLARHGIHDDRVLNQMNMLDRMKATDEAYSKGLLLEQRHQWSKLVADDSVVDSSRVFDPKTKTWSGDMKNSRLIKQQDKFKDLKSMSKEAIAEERQFVTDRVSYLKQELEQLQKDIADLQPSVAKKPRLTLAQEYKLIDEGVVEATGSPTKTPARTPNQIKRRATELANVRQEIAAAEQRIAAIRSANIGTPKQELPVVKGGKPTKPPVGLPKAEPQPPRPPAKPGWPVYYAGIKPRPATATVPQLKITPTPKVIQIPNPSKGRNLLTPQAMHWKSRSAKQAAIAEQELLLAKLRSKAYSLQEVPDARPLKTWETQTTKSWGAGFVYHQTPAKRRLGNLKRRAREITERIDAADREANEYISRLDAFYAHQKGAAPTNPAPLAGHVEAVKQQRILAAKKLGADIHDSAVKNAKTVNKNLITNLQEQELYRRLVRESNQESGAKRLLEDNYLKQRAAKETEIAQAKAALKREVQAQRAINRGAGEVARDSASALRGMQASKDRNVIDKLMPTYADRDLLITTGKDTAMTDFLESAYRNADIADANTIKSARKAGYDRVAAQRKADEYFEQMQEIRKAIHERNQATPAGRAWEALRELELEQRQMATEGAPWMQVKDVQTKINTLRETIPDSLDRALPSRWEMDVTPALRETLGNEPLALYKGGAAGPQGAYVFDKVNQKHLIFAFGHSPDITTFWHETAHMVRQSIKGVNPDLYEQATKAMERDFGFKIAKGKPWTREMDEKFAELFELYIKEGATPKVAPTGFKALKEMFEHVKEWIKSTYRALTNSPPVAQQGPVISDELREVFGDALGDYNRGYIGTYTKLGDVTKDVGFGDTNGIPAMIQALGPEADAVRASLTRRLGRGPTPKEILDQFDIPDEIVEDLKRYTARITDPKFKGWAWGLWDAYTNWFKTNVTATHPGFHVRNGYSGWLQNTMHGVTDPREFKNPLRKGYQHYSDMRGLMYGDVVEGASTIPMFQRKLAGMNLTVEQADKIATEEIQKMIFALGLMDSPGIYNDIVGALGGYVANWIPGSTKIAPNAQWRRYKEWIMNRATAPAGTTRGQSVNPIYTMGVASPEDKFLLSRYGRAIGDSVEAQLRGGGFIALLRQGFDPGEAARRIKELQLDYGNLTPFEKDWMRRGMPFYSYTRQMAAMAGAELYRRPGGPMAQSIRVANRASSDQGAVPDYVKQGLAIPMGTLPDGSKRFLAGFGLMHEQPLNMLQPDPQAALFNLFSLSNPIAKAPLELAANESFFQSSPEGGRSLDDMDPLLGRLLGNIRDTASLAAKGDSAAFMGGTTERTQAVDFERMFGKTGKVGESLVANSPLSRYLSTARVAFDPRKDPLTKMLGILTGVQLRDISEAAQQTVMREQIEAELKLLGGRTMTRAYMPTDIREAMGDTADGRAVDERSRALRLMDKMRRDRIKEQKAQDALQSSQANSAGKDDFYARLLGKGW